MIAESAMASEAIALAQQEEDLLETAVRAHARLVYRIAFSVVRNPADAEDATQEVFLRVLRYGKRITRIQDQKAWLARIAWRVAVQRRKTMAKLAAGTEEAGETLVAPGHGADRVLLEQERSALLERVLSALPSQLRDPLVLSALEEIAPREVAAMLGISEAAVRSRAFRAREILREKLLALTGPRT
ncbi:MAG: RNA polymerase sigma factor [Acidobacteriia bacterium]|nr:RNA polymerase sigma factor [Terriglobia bacterium]